MFNQDENRWMNYINEIILQTVTVKSHFAMIFGENVTKVYYNEQNMCAALF